MKKGFTLVELLGVIVLLGVIATIVVTIVDKTLKDSRNNAYDIQINNIIEDTKNYFVDNSNYLPSLGNSYTVTLKILRENGYVTEDIISPISKNKFSENTTIVVTNTNEGYKYSVNVIETE